MHLSESLLIGTVIKEPELLTAGTKKYVQLRLAENRVIPDQEEKHLYYTVTIWQESMMESVLSKVHVGNGIVCKLRMEQVNRDEKVNTYWKLLYFHSFLSEKQVRALETQIAALKARVKQLELEAQ